MKKACVIVSVFVLMVLAHPVHAATMMNVAGASADGSPSAFSRRVEYYLPYPGMLPDNPLYFLKNIRDRIIEVLISDPVNKSEFYILQADKKLNMGAVLMSEGKTQDAVKILDESLAHRRHAVDVLLKAQETGVTVPGYVFEKLVLSLQKHNEILSDLDMPDKDIDGMLDETLKQFSPTER